jgi:hypothetical protein
VTAIDADLRTATLLVSRRPDRRPSAGPAHIQVGVTTDAGGIYLVGGKVVKIPPWSPLLPMFEALASVQESESISNGSVRDLIQHEAWRSLGEAANTQLHRMMAYREPAPALREQTETGERS